MEISPALVAGAVWVLIAAVVALFPMRYQYPPGLALLFAAPVLLVWIAFSHGWIIAGAGAFAFASMFRNPIIYFLRRARGERPEIPI